MFIVKMPYNNHIRVPNVNSEYIARDILAVSFVCMVLIAWGRNEMVVQNAATNPIMVKRLLFITTANY